jgi:alpha-galactosidase
MLEVGNGMSESEDRTHFSIWCMLSAPLMMGNDIRSMTPATRSVLGNKNVIAIDQDPLGIQGLKYSDNDSLQIWLKPLKGGDWAVCFLNRSAKSRALSFDWKQLTYTDALSGATIDLAKNEYHIRNLWEKGSSATTGKTLSASVPAHDVILLRLSH